ncbi:spore cortex biosynthesis protein YabQ [Cohnella sp. CIP 111063]|uniref:spore cortex biosynthesis protein YabQ n=1 Tax=unclassified Cohnella TaxID=2636738 RepID=UPI000B8C4EB8|nr:MULTISPECIES: spore cortex biosynthesis protein YabQ [unclassified Cohnella]OXS54664.1 spore cortex biosynthesis protein YabQ [Cohnella sp. CIP 111063]
MNAAAQGMTIATMMLCGLAMGLAFDVYRVASHRFHVARWLLPALDVAYWAAATLGVFSVLLASNQGEVRMYVFLGLGIGVTGYFGLLSPWMVRFTGKLIDIVKSLSLFVWRLVRALLIVPVLWVVRLLAKLLDILFVVTAATLLWTGKLLFKPFGALGRWLWIKLLPARRRLAPVADAYRRFRDRLRQIRDIFRKKS